MIGSQVAGNQVIANVGTDGTGNLNIQSLQDTNQYKDKQQSIGGSVSVGYGKMGGSFNYSDSKTKSNYASVNEQAGIMAGDDGFQVNVAGNTNLTGAVIASSKQAIQDDKNTLSTETLTVTNIKNKAEYEASSTSIGGGYSSGGALVGKDQQGDAQTGDAKVPGTTLPSLNGFSATLPVALNADGKDDSTTISAISYGTINITNDAEQQAKTGKDAATTVATLNRDVHVDANGNAVDSQGNSTANTLTPIYNDEVRAEINAGFEIVRALTNETSTFLTNRAREIDQAEKEIKAELAKPESERDSAKLEQLSQTIIDNQTWAMGGTGRTIMTALTAAVSGNVTGTSGEFIQAATVYYFQSLGAQQIKQIADQIGGEGSAAHTALHAILACGGAVAAGGDCGTAALAASSGVVLNKLLDGIEGKDSVDLTAEEREARRNLIASLVTGITNAAGGNAAVANAAVAIETENNALPAVIAVATAAVFFSLQAADITLTAWDSYQLTQALATGDDEKAQELIASLAIGLATEAVPGNKIIQRVGDALEPLGKKGEELVHAAGEIVARNQALADTLLKRPDIINVKQVTTGSKGSWEKTINSKNGLEPNTGYVLDNGHSYITDVAGRVKEVGGELNLNKMDRNKYQQGCVNKCGEIGDDAGHLIASSLGGSGDKINLVPQASTLNRQDWRDMERYFEAELKAGKTVNMKIEVGYPPGGSARPNNFLVTAIIDGKIKEFPFQQ
jgi:filamentous hemagglutinin